MDLKNERNRLTTLVELKQRLTRHFNEDENKFCLSSIAKMIKKCGFRRKRVKKISVNRNVERTIRIR